MEGQGQRQQQRTGGGRRRNRRKAKSPKTKVVMEPVLIAARRPDSPLLGGGQRNVVASAQPKQSLTRGSEALSLDSAPAELVRPEEPRRRSVRIVKLASDSNDRDSRERQLLDRLVRSQGRGAISRAADDLLQGQFVPPKEQEIQIQLLEHEDEHRAREAVFAIAELLQREAPIKRPVLDQRLRRLEQSAEDPITRDAAGALRRSMRVHHGA